MYVNPNFKSKVAIRRAIKEGAIVRIFQPNDVCNNPKASPTYSGDANIEGPHYPEPHRWYGVAKVVNGKVVEVK